MLFWVNFVEHLIRHGWSRFDFFNVIDSAEDTGQKTYLIIGSLFHWDFMKKFVFLDMGPDVGTEIWLG